MEAEAVEDELAAGAAALGLGAGLAAAGLADLAAGFEVHFFWVLVGFLAETETAPLCSLPAVEAPPCSAAKQTFVLKNTAHAAMTKIRRIEFPPVVLSALKLETFPPSEFRLNNEQEILYTTAPLESNTVIR